MQLLHMAKDRPDYLLLVYQSPRVTRTLKVILTVISIVILRRRRLAGCTHP
jgi:hypothetical protein